LLLNPEAFRRVCAARVLLQDCDGAPFSVARVARLTGVSCFHFIRQFEAVFGRTPHQFRIEARLERARHLLATSERSVTDVCLDVGFSSLGSFSALFRRRVGESPSMYRRRLRTRYSEPGTRSAALTPGCLSLMSGLAAADSAPSRRNSREATGRQLP
jgi:AraC-like DNA-binding protein